VYRFHDIRPDWPIYGVIGNPIAHSLSPCMQNAALREAGVPGVYLPFKVECPPALFVRAFTALGLRGLSVTIPHKETVREACGALDLASQAIGAVNTLSWNGELWTGSNTDAPAAADSLQECLPDFVGKNVVVLGAGGAARAVVYGVKERGANTFVMNRNLERAQTLADELGARVLDLEAFAALHVDAVVNTTPLGMLPDVDSSPLEESQIPQGGLVFDTVYNPLRTKLLESAARRGCRTIEGVTMFVAQGARQFELWTGEKAPRELMKRVVLEELLKRNAKPSDSSGHMNGIAPR
jgi:shikimate dehydrogenase